MALIPLNPPAPDSFARRLPRDAPTALKYWHLASLDAPTVAVSWAAAFGWAAHTRAPLWQLTVLFLLVWVFYVVDRLLDARGRTHRLQERHFFHWQHRRVLVPLAAAAAGVSAWLIASRLSTPALARDSAVGIATMAYFSGVHSRKRLAPWLEGVAARISTREAVVGLIFSAGCVLPAAAAPSMAVWSAVLAPALAFAALAWLNVRAIEVWEERPLRLADAHIARIALGIAALAGGLAVSICWMEPRSAVLLLAAAASALLLGLLDRRRDSISAVALRAAADLVLLTPLVAIPLMSVTR